MIRVRVAVVVRQGERVLLVRHEKEGHAYWLLPGGGIEVGEAIHDAARRELREETGLAGDIERLLWLSETLAPDGSRHILHLTFLAGPSAGEVRVPEDERIRGAAFFGADEVEGLDLRPPLQRELAEGIRTGFAQPPQFLGARWVPESHVSPPGPTG
ncbi:MAG TPA: NUDIX hydrolase [Candidatus Xenobia bacterium]|jgi:8-oxo-dGTP diphosphatase